MLDAVRICGRWISKPLLARFSARALSPNPPTRRQCLKDFCRAIHWTNQKGELCLGSANVAIGRLEKLGHVTFPPAAPRKAQSAPRKLRDDGLPLPPLPKFPHSVELIGPLHLVLVRNPQEPYHHLWNRLICREHPLKAAPLVGAQLRYLIFAGTEVIGAFGVGPAAFALGSRDCWIGWDPVAQAQNRLHVLGLNRFLLRPGLKCANLASRCYALLFAQLRGDWQERYGILPHLVETYVDRSTHTGRSLAAANWLRIASTQGRGRSSPSRKSLTKSPKDVWVWQWDRHARAVLQRRELPQIVPRSLFCPSTDWVAEELDGLDLGHQRLDHRFGRMLAARWAHPGWSFYSSFETRAEGMAAYRFLENPRAELSFEALLAPHQNSTRRRMAAERVVLLAQDTTPLSYNTLQQTQGLGPVGSKVHPGRGLLLHSLQGFRLDGIPVGCAWAEVTAREAASESDRRNERSIDQKESRRWLDAYQAAAIAARQMPQTTLLVCGDRESDIMDLYDRATVAPKNLFLLVRAQHDRILQSGQKLKSHLASQPLGGTISVNIPRNNNQAARTATLELRWTQVSIVAPRVGGKNSWGPLALFALEAKELQPPAGAEPIHWVLLTDWKINSLKMARRILRWYGLRWGIECWHQVLKDGCGVETRQLKSAQTLTRSLVLDMIVAWRILWLCRLGKQCPEMPASVLYSPEELSILEVIKKSPPARCF